MRFYSKFRLVLFAALMGVMILAASGYGQANGEAAPANGNSAPSAQSGVFSLILQNMDPIFGIIAVLSVAGLTLIIQGFIKARRSVIMPESSINRIRELIQQRQFRELLEFTERDPSFVSQSLSPALKRAPNFQAMKEAMETAIGEQTADQFRRIEYLNIIGNLGPLLGLLGTVLGMIYSFQAMHEKGGMADPATLAGGISKALAHTFLGLALALPCLAAFGVLRTLIDRLTVQAALVAEELLLMTRPQDPRPAAPAVPPVRATGLVPPAVVGAGEKI